MRQKRNKLLAITLLAALPLFSWVAVAQAQSFRSADDVIVAVGETVDSSLYIASKSVDIAGTVNGDVYCVGQSIVISGTVTGDVFCAGQTVRISGRVEGSVRVAGQIISSSATIGRNLSATAQSITLEAESRVGGDAAMAGQDVIIGGLIGRDVLAASGITTVRGQIGRNLQGSMERLTLGPGMVIGGDVKFTSPNELSRQSGAQVVGEVRRSEPSQSAAQDDNGKTWLLALWLFAAMLTLALTLVLLVPGVFQAAASQALQRPGRTVLIGIAASLLAPIAIIGLMLTIIGIPLGILALLICLVVALLSGPAAAYVLGRLILQKHTVNSIWYILVGVTTLFVVYLIPVVGLIAALLVHWYGVGVILQYFGRKYKKPHYQVIAEPKAKTIA